HQVYRVCALRLAESNFRHTQPRRQFYYQAPVADLLKFGVQSGTRLSRVVGTVINIQERPTSSRKLCGALSYAVLGSVSLDDRTSQCTQKSAQRELELSCDWIIGTMFLC